MTSGAARPRPAGVRVVLAVALVALAVGAAGCTRAPELGGPAAGGSTTPTVTTTSSSSGGASPSAPVGTGTPLAGSPSTASAGSTAGSRPTPPLPSTSTPAATGPVATGAPAVTNTSVRTGTAATVPAAGRAVLFGGITVTSCPPSPTTCEDVLVPVAGTVRVEQLDVPAGQAPTIAGTETDGLFNLELAPGRWRISAYAPTLEPCPVRDVTLSAGQTMTVTLTCRRTP